MEKVQSLSLEINHIQGKDKEYADILNRVREGKHTEEDTEKLKEKILPYDHPDLDEVALFIVCVKKLCGKINNQYINTFPGDEMNIQAKHFLTTEKKF